MTGYLPPVEGSHCRPLVATPLGGIAFAALIFLLYRRGAQLAQSVRP